MRWTQEQETAQDGSWNSNLPDGAQETPRLRSPVYLAKHPGLPDDFTLFLLHPIDIVAGVLHIR